MPWTKINSKFCRVVISYKPFQLDISASGQAFSLAVVQAAEQQPNEHVLMHISMLCPTTPCTGHSGARWGFD